MSKFTHQNILCDEIYFLITNYETILNDISFSICRGNFRHIFVNVSFVLSENKKVTQIARSDEFHRALLLEAQHSINNNLNLTIVQNMTYRGRQGRVISEITFDLSDIY